MADVELHSAAGPAAGHRIGQCLLGGCGRALLAVVLALVTTITVPVVLAARPAGADQVSNLQAQARQISQQILKDQLEMGGLQQQYEEATQKLQEISNSIAQTRATMETERSKIVNDHRQLRGAAIFAYMDASATTGATASQMFGSNERTAQVRSEYQGIVAGDVTASLDRLRLDQEALRHQQAALRSEQGQVQATQQQALALVQQANQTQSQLQDEQSQVKGQLAAAIQAQQQAQAAAAQAAIAQAQQAAAAQAAAAQREQVQQTTTTAGAAAVPQGTTPVPPPASGTAPALNSFLQCVIQAESGGNYGAVSPDGQFMGAFQFDQSSWNQAALLAGMPDLVGVPPNTASVADQDALAIALYNADGQAPWYDPCNTTGHG